jgi:hypothetical protein
VVVVMVVVVVNESIDWWIGEMTSVRFLPWGTCVAGYDVYIYKQKRWAGGGGG